MDTNETTFYFSAIHGDRRPVPKVDASTGDLPKITVTKYVRSMDQTDWEAGVDADVTRSSEASLLVLC